MQTSCYNVLTGRLNQGSKGVGELEHPTKLEPPFGNQKQDPTGTQISGF